MYTLTASNSRSKVLFAKILTISTFGIVFALVVSTFTPVLDYLGIHAHGHTLVPQVLNYGNLLWRSLYFGWGIATTGLLLATLIRNQVGAIVVLFLVQTVESGLLSPVLKGNSVYLPFMSLDEVLMPAQHGTITHAHAAMVFSVYLVVGWLVAWTLFLRRDAN
jgi:hypothetical protein